MDGADAARVVCKIFGDGACVPCDEDEREESFCLENGYKQQLRCLETKPTPNQSYIEAETTSYYKWTTCPLVHGDFMNFVRFEVRASSSSRAHTSPLTRGLSLRRSC